MLIYQMLFKALLLICLKVHAKKKPKVFVLFFIFATLRDNMGSVHNNTSTHKTNAKKKGIIVLGGIPGAYEEDKHPWLKEVPLVWFLFVCFYYVFQLFCEIAQKEKKMTHTSKHNPTHTNRLKLL